MGQWESNEKKAEQKRRFSQEQYEMLKRCSDKKDMTEWNEWRKEHSDKDIFLEGSSFEGYYLKAAYLNKGEFVDQMGAKYNFKGEVHLEGAKFRGAKLEDAIFHNAKLQDTKFNSAILKRTIFQGASLQGANFYRAHLQNADFLTALVDGATSFWEAKVNCRSRKEKGTNFLGVGLASVRIQPRTKRLLEYNIKRKSWEEWYKIGPLCIRILKRLLVQPFWWISDYGLSAPRILEVFFLMALLFANVYYYWWRIAPPGIVNHLSVDRCGDEVPQWLVSIRSLYFSIVTMTTLGFGDMYAKAQSFFGHLLLMLQVLLGYILLGALITRFAVSFTAGGPADKFEHVKKTRRW